MSLENLARYVGESGRTDKAGGTGGTGKTVGVVYGKYEEPVEPRYLVSVGEACKHGYHEQLDCQYSGCQCECHKNYKNRENRENTGNRKGQNTMTEKIGAVMGKMNLDIVIGVLLSVLLYGLVLNGFIPVVACVFVMSLVLGLLFGVCVAWLQGEEPQVVGAYA